MKHYLHALSILFFISSLVLPPFLASPSLITAMECPATNNLADYLTDQVDVRASAVPGAERTDSMEMFSTRNTTTGEGYSYNEDNWLRQNTGFLHKSLNLSGTSYWNTSYKNWFAGSLVTPQHVVVAGHARMTLEQSSKGGVYHFMDHDGVLYKRTITKERGVQDGASYKRTRPDPPSTVTDLVIQELNEPLPDSVHVYKIIDHDDLAQYIDKERKPERNSWASLGIPAINFNQFDQVGTRDVSYLSNRISSHEFFNSFSASEYFRVIFQNPREDRDRASFQKGMVDHDSGDAAFFIVDNELTLLMTNYSAGQGPSHGGYIDEMNTIIEDWGTTSYQVERVDLGCFSKRNNLPEIDTTQDLYIKSDVAVGANFGRIDVSDREDGRNIGRFILWGNGQVRDNFMLDKDSGLLSVVGRIDDLGIRSNISDNVSEISFNEGEVYDLELIAQDNNSVPASGRGNVRVHVVNNNSSPVIIPDIFQTPLRVRSGLTEGTSVTQMNVEDADEGDTFTWSLGGATCSGSGAESPFEIVPETGRIIISTDSAKKSLLNENTNPECTLTVIVSDSGVPMRTDSYEIDVVITSDTMINRSPIIKDQMIGTVNESSFFVQSIGSVQASDPDISQKLTYEITEGSDGELFTINSETGWVQIKDASKVDYETKSEYVFSVRVTDDYDRAGYKKSAGAVITVGVRDKEEGLGLISDGDVKIPFAFIPENSTPVGTFRIDDPDTEVIVKYEIISASYPAGEYFVVDEQTGRVELNQSVDYEDFFQGNLLRVGLKGTDNLGRSLLEVIVTMILDVDEGKNITNPKSHFFDRAEDISVRVETSSDDILTNSGVAPLIPYELVYSITGGADKELFTINSQTGILTARSSASISDGTYEVEISAEDKMITDVDTYHYLNIEDGIGRVLIPATDGVLDERALQFFGLNQDDVSYLLPGFIVPLKYIMTSDLQDYRASKKINIILGEESDKGSDPELPAVESTSKSDPTKKFGLVIEGLPVILTEGGVKKTITLSLDEQPEYPVSVILEKEREIDFGSGANKDHGVTLSSTSPKTVFLEAVDDSEEEDSEVVEVSMALSSDEKITIRQLSSIRAMSGSSEGMSGSSEGTSGSSEVGSKYEYLPKIVRVNESTEFVVTIKDNDSVGSTDMLEKEEGVVDKERAATGGNSNNNGGGGGGGSSPKIEYRGCTDKKANNYDRNADRNDGTCEYDLLLEKVSQSEQVVEMKKQLIALLRILLNDLLEQLKESLERKGIDPELYLNR